MQHRLNELFHLQMGKTPSREKPEYWEKGTNKWISISDLSNCSMYTAETKETITDCAVRETNIRLVPKNTVIMSFKLSIGKTAITSEPVYTNEAIMAFVNKDEKLVLPEFLYYQLLSKDWGSAGNRAVMGATLNKASLSQMKINVPSLQEQQGIVQVLSQIDSQLKKADESVNKLDGLVKSRFIEMFGDPNHSHSHNAVYLEDAFDVRDDLRKPLNSKTRSDMKAGELYPYYGANGIVDFINAFITDCDALCFAEDCGSYGADEQSTYIVRGKAWVNNHAHFLLAKPCCILEWANVYFYLLDIGKMISGTTRSKLTQAQLKRIMVDLPPLALQQEFADFVAQVDKLRFEACYAMYLLCAAFTLL